MLKTVKKTAARTFRATSERLQASNSRQNLDIFVFKSPKNHAYVHYALSPKAKIHDHEVKELIIFVVRVFM